jgi:hypothetical protein
MTVIYNMSIDRADKPWIGDRRLTEETDRLPVHSVVLHPLSLRAIMSFLLPAALTLTVLASADGPLSVRSFGALGDGVSDDGPLAAIQRAMNATAAAGNHSTLYFPDGTYLVKAPLAMTCRRLLGESNFGAVLRAARPMAAVLAAPGSHPAGSGWTKTNSTAKTSRTNDGLCIEQLTLDAHGLADFAFYGALLTRSRFVRSAFTGGRVVVAALCEPAHQRAQAACMPAFLLA